MLVDRDLVSIADRRLIRASRGYVFSLPIVLASRAEALRYFQDSGMRLMVFDADGELTVGDLGGIDERIALMFGSETTGASGEFSNLSTENERAPGRKLRNTDPPTPLSIGSPE